MNIPDILARAKLLGRHEHERTWRLDQEGHPLIIKALRLPEGSPRPPVPRLPDLLGVSGLVPWTQFLSLEDQDIKALDLGQGSWRLAIRPYLPGQNLSELGSGSREQWRTNAYALALRVRDLHDLGIVHGDLQPGNVIIDPAANLWLIDLAIFETRIGEAQGHVLGSPPLMAPELWRGTPPTQASDAYALATLVHWLATGDYPRRASSLSAWAQVHQEPPTLSPLLPSPLSALLSRMLDNDAELRSPVQELLDALKDDAAPPQTSYVAAPSTLLTAEAPTLLEELDRRTFTSLILSGPARSGKSRLLTTLARHAELAGREVYLVGHDRVQGPASWGIQKAARPKTTGPFALLLALIDALDPDVLDLHPTPRGVAPQGDRLHIFEELYQTFCRALSSRALATKATQSAEILLCWDDLDRAGPDLCAWWGYLFDRLRSQGTPAPLTFIATSTNALEDLEWSVFRPKVIPSKRDWNRFRATSLRPELRDLPRARWETLVERHIHEPERLLEAINEHLGTLSSFDTATTPVPAQRSIEDIQTLFAEGAYGAVTQACRRVCAPQDPRCGDDPQVLLPILTLWAEAAALTSGNVEEAERLEQALRALRDRIPTSWALSERVSLSLLLVGHLYHLGRHREGLEILDDPSLRTSALSALDQIRLEAWTSQLCLSSGQGERALDHGRAGLETYDALSPDARSEVFVEGLQLQLLTYAAGALGGDANALDDLRKLTPRLEDPRIPATLRARAHAYRALGLTRQDALDEATDAYLRALEEVESAGLDAELPTYLLNVGTAYHRQGRLGLAREYYARGSRIALPTTRASTRALLYANEANVNVALSRFDEAWPLVEQASQIARNQRLPTIEVMCHSLRGDILLGQGHLKEALATYSAALDEQHLPLTSHQRASLLLYRAEAHLRLEDPRAAQKVLDEARRILEEDQIHDLEHHHHILRARLQWTDGGTLGTMAGIELFRRSLLQADRAGNHKLVLNQSEHLLAKLAGEGLIELHDEVDQLVERSKNAIAMGLTRELREDFFAHTKRGPQGTPKTHRTVLGGPDGAPRTPDSPAHQALVERFYRMLAMNEIILTRRRPAELWQAALQTALALSGAERGYLLIHAPNKSRVGDYQVVASRDIDDEPIPRPHLKVSLTIAEEAARTGNTVITVNARQDERFSEALSVVDLDLTSVLCVPLRDATGLLGALYLDHRFQPGVFSGEVPRMMEAFGHQVALAITNTRHLEELREERARQEALNARLNALLIEREQMLAGLEERYDRLSEQVERQRLTRQGESNEDLRDSFPDIAFTSRAMESVLDQVQRVARGDVSVVICGESGVGKELIARAVHDASPRCKGPFVPFNCGAIAESLIESELFGHEKGAFTGADVRRIGLFQAAQGGTLFLDEVGDMPLSMQVKLLRALQEKQVRRVGSAASETVDVRIVAATHRDLAQMVEEKTFREDLYWRLAAIVLDVPPLRERREDIPILAQHLLTRIAPNSIGRQVRLRPDGARILSMGRWPGNVRELENTLRTACVLTDADELGEADFAPLMRIDTARIDTARIDTAGLSLTSSSPSSKPSPPTASRGRKPKASRSEVVEALRRAGSDGPRAAQLLGVSERTLYRYINRYDIESR